MNEGALLPARAGAPSRAGKERRVWIRLSCELEGDCLPFSGGETEGCAAIVHDVSAGGISLALRGRFEMGTVLALQLQGRTGTLPWVPLARVVHVVQGVSGEWLLGCAFIGRLSERQLADLVS